MPNRVHFQHILLSLIALLMPCSFLSGQVPFARTGQVFLVSQGSNEVFQFLVSPVYNTLQTDVFGSKPAGGLDAIGFRKTDNLLYGINPGNNHLIRMDKNGTVQDLGLVGLDNALFYLAGDVSPDGKYLVTIGSNPTGTDVHLAKTDLETAGYPTQFQPINTGGHLTDIAFDPYTGQLFGYDEMNTVMVSINPGSGVVKPFLPLIAGNNFYGLYFDAFGDLYAYGSTLYGIVDGIFRIDKNTGKETRLTTGPAFPMLDAASCPFSVELKANIDPETTLPCSEISCTYTLANGSTEVLSGIDFQHPLPAGFHFAGVQQNLFGGLIDTLSVPGSISMKGLTLQPGINKLVIKLRVDDIPKGIYKSQAGLTPLPALYGTTVLSDNPRTAGFEDSSLARINRFDEDSLFYNWFICHGETIELDGTPFGGNVHWSTGASNPVIAVTQGGLFTMEAGTTCESIVVSHNVTSASCPYTISVKHVFLPDTLFACSELIFRFILDNDSGEPRFNLSIMDSLPPGFTFVKILDNPFGGTVQPGLPPDRIGIQGMNLKPGVDTLDVLVRAGDVVPGDYRNRAILYNLPLVMGPTRLSDNPDTQPFDSSAMHILGALADTLFFDETVCAKGEITLDASQLGKNFLWEDGSTGPQFLVEHPGDYHLTLFDGCNPSEVYWHVVEGTPVQVIPPASLQIHQGQQIEIRPVILNGGDSLIIQWTDPLGNSLSCLDCPNPLAVPLQSTVYGISVFNGICSDSAGIELEVDQSRRIFAPNVFSPNDDGLNDYFYLQSPDYGKIGSFRVLDRWGNEVFYSGESEFNVFSDGWDGRFQGKDMPEGVYLWWAEVGFLDGTTQVFKGDITLVRRSH